MSEKAENRPEAPAIDTRERILEAAAELFADCGFRSVSLRQITQAAGVNLASVNYHFGSKDSLVLEVLSRVVGPINQRRLAMLEEAERDADGAVVPIERVLEALIAPALPGLQPVDESALVPVDMYLRLVGRCMSERQDVLPDTLMTLFRQMIERFRDVAMRSLPGVDSDAIYWRLHFTAGALLYTLTQPERLTMFSEGTVDGADTEEMLRHLVAFTAAGMRAEPVALTSLAPKPEGRHGNPKRAAVSALAGVLALVSIGCAAQSPDSMNDSIDVATAEAYAAGEPGSGRPLADTDWISRFGDRRLDSLVAEVTANNKDLQVAEARLRAAEATAQLAGVDARPRVDANLGGSRANRNFIGFPFGGAGGEESGGSLSSLTNDFGLSLDLIWEIDLWGRIRTEQSGAIAAMESSEAELSAARLSIAGQTAKIWFSLIEARQQENLARETVELFRQTEKTIGDHFALGIEDQGGNRASQLRLAKTDIATAEEALVQRQQATRQLARQLETLLARYPAAEIDAIDTLPRMGSAPPAGVPADLLDRRPDLVKAERDLAAADRRYAAARLLILPSISLTGSGGTASEMIENLVDRNFSVWSVAGSVAQPILTGGQIREGIKLRKNEIEQARGAYEKAILEAFREVEDALDLEGLLATRQRLLEEAVDLANDAYRQASEEYSEGVGDILTLLSAQRRKVQSETQLIAIRRLRLDNRVDLHLALGGDYRVRRKA